jgi:hypothetical protein
MLVSYESAGTWLDGVNGPSADFRFCRMLCLIHEREYALEQFSQ